MEQVKFLDLAAHYSTMKVDIDTAMNTVVTSCDFVNGRKKLEFEQQFAEYIGTNYCVGVGNGTDALEIGIKSLGLPAGSEVITQPNSYIATALGITWNGLTPVFVDIDPNTMMMDTTKIEEKITPNTRAICVVHLYGCSPNMGEILRIIKKHGLTLIEDCAQSHGATYNGQNAGSFGDISCFSFYPGKNLGCFGDGGAICTKNEDIYHSIKLLHNMGSDKKYYHDVIGRNSRLDTLQAAVLSSKLLFLDRNNQLRRDIANHYRRRLTGCPELVLPNVEKGCIPVWHLFVIRVHDRDSLQSYLKVKGIDTGIHYPVPIHKQKAYAFLGHLTYPVSELCAAQILSLPMYPELSMGSVDRVCDMILEYYNASRTPVTT